MKKETEKRIEETMQSIDQIQRAIPDSYLVDQIMDRLAAPPARIVAWRPIYQWGIAACLLALVGANVLACLQYNTTANTNSMVAKEIEMEYFSHLNQDQIEL